MGSNCSCMGREEKMNPETKSTKAVYNQPKQEPTNQPGI